MKKQPTIEQVEAAFGAGSIIAREARAGRFPTAEAVERRLASRDGRRYRAGQRYEARAAAAALKERTE